MHCSRKLAIFSALCALSASPLAAKEKEKGKDDNAPKKETAKKKKVKGDDEDDEKSKKSKKGADAEQGGNRMSLPLIKGHDSKGLRIPYFDSTGKLQMTFVIGLADRLDDDHVKMKEMQVETFDDKGSSEMVIDLPSSVLDLNTRIITTNESVTVKRVDFEITGKTMEFNTETKQGKLGGHVRMLIYNLDNAETAKPEATSGE